MYHVFSGVSVYQVRISQKMLETFGIKSIDRILGRREEKKKSIQIEVESDLKQQSINKQRKEVFPAFEVCTMVEFSARKFAFT